VTCRRDRIQLRDPGTQRWAVSVNASGRVVDGAVLFEGRTIALVFAHADTFTQLVVLGLHDGAIHHRLTLSGVDLVRFAAARGYALLRSEAHTLCCSTYDSGACSRSTASDPCSTPRSTTQATPS
jgi:hypothetical protein